MFFLRTLSFISTLILFSAAALAQETSLDLRKDGRVLSGDRKDFFLRKVKSSEYKVTEYLRNRFGNTRVAAIVIPPGKTGERYMIGVVPGDGTLPDDWPISEDEFKLLRDIAINKRMAKVDTGNWAIRVAAASNRNDVVDAKAVELTATIAGNTTEANRAASYAGYILQDFAKASEVSALAAIVSNYRAEEIRSLEPTILKAMGFKRLAQGAPVILTEADQFFSAKDLDSSKVERQFGKGGVAFLTLWYGRSLIIVPEREGMPFSTARHRNLVGYLAEANPTANNGAFVRDYANVFRDSPNAPQQ